MEFLAAGQRDVDLDPATPVEEHLEGNDGEALAQNARRQLVDFLAMKQQLARPLGLVVEAVGFAVFRNVGIDQEQFQRLATADTSVA